MLNKNKLKKKTCKTCANWKYDGNWLLCTSSKAVLMRLKLAEADEFYPDTDWVLPGQKACRYYRKK